MKIPREQLTIALKPASDILRAKATHDSPRYLKVEAAKGKLILSANDSNQSAVTEVECEGDLKPTLIQIANLQNIMPLFGDNVTIENGEKDLRIRSGGNNYFRLPVAPLTEFQVIVTDKLTKIAVNCKDLADCMDRVKFAARKEDSRPPLFGVNVRLSATKIIAEASTGLIFAQMTKASIAADAEFLIPFPFVANVVTNLRQPGAVLSVGATRISISFDGGCYSCGLMEVKFLNLNKQIEQKRSKIGEITPREWLPVFRTIEAMAGESGKMMAPVTVEAGRVKFEGENGTVDRATDKLSKKLRLNAATFTPCLEAFGEGVAKVSLYEEGSLCVEQGDLLVASTQLRG